MDHQHDEIRLSHTSIQKYLEVVLDEHVIFGRLEVDLAKR